MADRIGGVHAVAAALRRSPALVETLWVISDRRDQRFAKLLSLAMQAGVTVQASSPQALDRLLPGVRHQGVVALMKPDRGEAGLRAESALSPLLARVHTPLVLALDGVKDPHNLGACLRTAEAAGVTAVVVPRDRAVGLTPTVSKVACGAAQSVPVVGVTNLARTLAQLADAGLWVVGLAGEAQTSLYDADLTGPLVLVLGAEAGGLRRLTKARCQQLARIPMAGSVESLNVSVAAGIALFEAVRRLAA